MALVAFVTENRKPQRVIIMDDGCSVVVGRTLVRPPLSALGSNVGSSSARGWPSAGWVDSGKSARPELGRGEGAVDPGCAAFSPVMGYRRFSFRAGVAKDGQMGLLPVVIYHSR